MQEQETTAQRPNVAAVSPIIRLHQADNVVMARVTLLPGTPVQDGVIAAQRIPPGHKVAVRRIEEGEQVRKYNQIIGFATKAIAPGEHVHVQNMGMGDFAKDYAYGVDAKPTDLFPEPATFEGIVRPDGVEGRVARESVRAGQPWFRRWSCDPAGGVMDRIAVPG